jgi:phospholipid/cholesterol/gamma-HCH transport system substrate-binding protein
MSMPKEVRIGILVGLSILIFFVGFYFLKGSDIFSRENEYTCFYTSVEGLQPSAMVQIRGLNVGHVSKTELVDGNGVRVVISVNKGIDIPKGTIAWLASADLLGTKMIRLDLGKGPELVANKDSLPTEQEGGILDNVSKEITPLIKDVRVMVGALDSVLVGVNTMVGAQNQQALSSSMASLSTTTKNFADISQVLRDKSDEINGIINNVNSVTANLSKNNSNIQQILDNVHNTTNELSKAPIQQTFTDLQTTVSQLQGVIDKINSNKGSLGMMVNDKDLYNNLNTSLQSLNVLMTDLKAHPSRYINVTIFGKKKAQ